MITLFEKLFKRNPYHDKLGRFSSAQQDAFAGGKAHVHSQATGGGSTVSVASVIDSTLSPADAKEVRGILHGLSTSTVPDSQSQHSVPGKNGGRLYSKERQALHREIIGKYFEKHAAEKGNSPEMIILGGIGGSGKSSFGDQAKTNPLGLYQEKKFMVIDSDGVKAMIPGFNGGNAAVYHEESSYLMRKIVTRARAQGYNVVLDQTMSKPADATIQAFKKAGYKTAAYYMYVPPATAASRALSRWRSKGPGQRGRLVPPSIILGSTQNPKNFDRAAKMVDKHAFYDNQGAAPRLVFKGP